MDPIKQAFQKIKQDIDFLFQEIQGIKRTLEELKIASTQPQDTSTISHITSILPKTSTDNLALESQKSQNLAFSIGNQGVSTDRQTDRQTDRHIQKFAQTQQIQHQTDKISQLQRASEILESLDSLKKEVRFKFKQLTNQEMLIFMTIYQLEEQGLSINYNLLAKKLQLSESSIRDHVGKIIKKGVPLDKIKRDNKKITLSIPPDLKKIASLNTIIQLREL